MNTEVRVKTRNVPLVGLFVIWCTALHLALYRGLDVLLSGLVDAMSRIRGAEALLIVASPLAVVILTGILSSGAKARIVFWRWRHALPGHRAFSELAPADVRINMARLRSRVCPWPDSPETENRTWYLLYKKHGRQIAVARSHGAFLLSRELTVVAFLFLIVGPWGFFGREDAIPMAAVYGLAMALQYLLLVLVSRNHGRRFVCNVLAEHAAGGES